MQNAGLDESTSWNQDCWEKYQQAQIWDDTTLMTEKEEELKNLLMKVKEESEKTGLKPNIQKTKNMASGPTTSWQTDGETMETVKDFFWAPKSLQMVTSTMKLKEAPWKKSYDKRRYRIKSRDITLSTMV